MRRSIKDWVRGLLGRIKSIADPLFAAKDANRQAMLALHAEIAEVKAGISMIQQQVVEILTQIKALGDALATVPREFPASGNKAVQNAAAADWEGLSAADIRNAAKRLNEAAAGILTAFPPGPLPSVARVAFATHLTRSADMISRSWLAQGRPTDLFPDDDFTLDYAIRSGVYASDEEEAPVEPTRQTLPWRHLVTDPDCAVFLVLGQSNAANHGGTRHTAEDAAYSFDFLRMNCYRADDPLPGASGNGGSVWSRLGSRLVEAKLFRRILFVPLAFGGTFITDWTPHHKSHKRTALALSRLRKELGMGPMPFSGVFWQQGEAEANHTRMSAEEYKAHFHDIVRDLRANGVFSPVFVALATLCEVNAHPFTNHEAVRAAQSSLPDATAGIFAGPDVDGIGLEKRYDGCHLASSGLEACCELWFEVLLQHKPLLIKA